MPNSYDALLDASEQTATQPNEYDALLDADAQRSQLRASMVVASDNDPDKYAEAKRLSRATGIPAPAISHDMPTVARRVKLNEYDQLLDTSPALVKHLQSPDFASLAQDDTGVLSKVENATRAFTSGAIPATASGIYSLAAAPFDLLSQFVTGPLTGKLLPEDIGAKIGDTLRGLAAQQNQRASQAVSVPGAGTVEQSIYSGLQSFGQNIGPLALSVITGQPELALGVMSAMTGGQSVISSWPSSGAVAVEGARLWRIGCRRRIRHRENTGR